MRLVDFFLTNILLKGIRFLDLSLTSSGAIFVGLKRGYQIPPDLRSLKLRLEESDCKIRLQNPKFLCLAATRHRNSSSLLLFSGLLDFYSPDALALQKITFRNNYLAENYSLFPKMPNA